MSDLRRNDALELCKGDCEIGWRRNRRALDLGDPADNGKPTSREAAKKAKPRVVAIRKRILDRAASCRSRGTICEEAPIALNLRTPTANGQFSELMEAGFLRNTGRTRDTTSGTPAAVYVVPKGAGDG